MLALERSDHGFSGESRGGHARRERLPQAGLHGSHCRWATRHSLSGRKQGATARHVTTPTPERYFSTENGQFRILQASSNAFRRRFSIASFGLLPPPVSHSSSVRASSVWVTLGLFTSMERWAARPG